MAVSRTFSVVVNFNGIVATYTGTLTGDAELNINADIAGATTNAEIVVAWRAAGLKGWVLLADGALTVKTNSTSAPDSTFTLVANTPLFWFTGTGPENPIDTDVAKFYVTNAGGSSVNFRAFAVSDQTP